MVAVHRETVVDTTEEAKELREEWQGYIEKAEEYSAWLKNYSETAWTDQVRGESLGVETALDQLVDAREEMMVERKHVNFLLNSSSLKGHISYPFLNDEAEVKFEKRYGEKPLQMKKEEPRDFYYTIASEFIEEEGVEWVVEEENVGGIEDLKKLLEEDRESGVVHVPVQSDRIPGTVPSGKRIEPPFFDELINAHEKTGNAETYDILKRHEDHVTENYGRSALMEVLGFTQQKLVEEINEGNEFMKATELN